MKKDNGRLGSPDEKGMTPLVSQLLIINKWLTNVKCKSFTLNNQHMMGIKIFFVISKR